MFHDFFIPVYIFSTYAAKQAGKPFPRGFYEKCIPQSLFYPAVFADKRYSLCLMMTESETRQLLIDSCHSSMDAEQRILRELNSPEFICLLARIAIDADDHQGDAPMTAAYYLAKASPQLTKAHEAALLSLLTTADGYVGSVALVLGGMKSSEAKPLIVRMAAEGYWPQEAFSEALLRYEA